VSFAHIAAAASVTTTKKKRSLIRLAPGRASSGELDPGDHRGRRQDV